MDFYNLCKDGKLEEVKILLESGEKNFDRGLNGACIGGHLELAKLMLEKGATSYDTGLHYAFFGGHLRLVKLMIDKGADNIHKYYKYPEHKKELITLIELGVSLTKFEQVENYSLLVKDIDEIKYIMSSKLGQSLLNYHRKNGDKSHRQTI